jgi:hypothetical protein
MGIGFGVGGWTFSAGTRVSDREIASAMRLLLLLGLGVFVVAAVITALPLCALAYAGWVVVSRERRNSEHLFGAILAATVGLTLGLLAWNWEAGMLLRRHRSKL